MKKINILFFFLFFSLKGFSQNSNYQRTWATYFGDESMTLFDSATDRAGNLYLVGSIDKLDFFDSNFTTTLLAYQPNYGGGYSDAFIVKINPAGQVVWSTYFGGENSDYIIGIVIDKNDFIYVEGTTSSTQNIASSNSFQSNINGNSDAFIAKFSSSGNKIWCTYYDSPDAPSVNLQVNLFSTNANNDNEIITVDDLGYVYLSTATNNPSMATTGVFQTALVNTSIYEVCNLISKFDSNGNRIWATYYGINGSAIHSLIRNTSGLYVTGITSDCVPTYSSNNYFATTGCHQPIAGVCKNYFLSKFSFDGTRDWSTYYGNSTQVYLYPKTICDENYIYLSGLVTRSQDAITTTGAYQEGELGITGSFIAKFDNNGIRQWATLFGKTIVNNNDIKTYISSISLDASNNIHIGGTTNVADNIATVGCYQESLSGLRDSFIAKITTDGFPIWASYYGGTNNDWGMRSLPFNDSFYLIGNTKSTDSMTTTGCLQSNYTTNAVPNINYSPLNIFIARFDPATMATNEFSASNFTVFPNPSQGSFTIKSNDFLNAKLQLFDINGRIVLEQNLQNLETTISTKNLASGIYLAKIYTNDNQVVTKKIVVE